MRFLHRRAVLWAERRESKSQIFAGKVAMRAQSARKKRRLLHGRKRMRLPHNKKRSEKGNMGC